jgi:3-phenylpropionate/trans-cinnamate dioxygenase ferredoxin reductase subunit
VSAGVVIVGAGLAGQRCCAALRGLGWEGPIRLVGDERHRPYDRPPLSKALLAGDAEPAEVALRPAAWYAERGVEVLLGTRAAGLDPAARRVVMADGARLDYKRLVIATGGAPRMLPALGGRGNVHALRTLDDALALRAVLVPGLRLVVVGAGLVGLEVAATARALGAVVTVVEAAAAPLAAVLGPRIGSWLADLHAAAGVEVLAGARIEAVHGAARVTALALAGGRRLACDAVLVAVGLAPATGWLAGGGLPPGAIAVDGAGRTALPHVYAAGDATGAGHWEAAARQGAAAAASVVGRAAPAPGPPSFWSDQHGVRLQFAGTAAGHDHVQVEGNPAAGDARALFLRGGRPIGGLLVGRPRELPALRRLLHDTETEPERSAA